MHLVEDQFSLSEGVLVTKEASFFFDPAYGHEGAIAYGPSQGRLVPEAGVGGLVPPISRTGSAGQQLDLDQSGYPATVPAIELSTFLPGTLKRTSEWCGEVRGYAVCPEHLEDHPKFPKRGNSCGDPGCPICWTTWALRGADRIGSRVQGYQDAGGRHGRPKHVILSVPKNLYRPDLSPAADASRLKPILNRMLLKIGSVGGCHILHRYRIRGVYVALVRANKDGRKIGDWESLKEFPNWREMIEYSPHCHSASYGFLMPADKVPGGWVYKNRGLLRYRDDIERMAFYALSHVAVIRGSTSMSYYGCCSTRALKKIEHVVQEEPMICPICGAFMHFMHADGEITEALILVRKSMHLYQIEPGPPP